ncbi:MAG TPA: transposase [Coxiellaceae bacterium]|nr:MAG: hypothetical protein A3E81_06395 [Gammaproteobacteria bacterium RIFCSPHIGHO2_12_FULL_36_30]HLB56824.1 transposase [Coxiellaceae bacterium]
MKTEDKIPLAYFITFRTYATWLHGDERSSVSRTRNKVGTPKIHPNKNLETQMQALQKDECVILSREHGDVIREATVNLCNKNNWRLYAMHIRSNHVHLTIKADDEPEKMMTKIKSNATFALRKKCGFAVDQKIWSRHGSTKYIWTPESLYYTSDYTTECQGQKMAYYFNL